VQRARDVPMWVARGKLAPTLQTARVIAISPHSSKIR
jgi:hypothetical protein